jgi:hypothetical protein
MGKRVRLLQDKSTISAIKLVGFLLFLEGCAKLNLITDSGHISY